MVKQTDSILHVHAGIGILGTPGRPASRVKEFRRVATRCDKLAFNFLASIVLAAAVICWLN